MNKIKAYFDGISHGKDHDQLADDIIRRANSTAKKHSFCPAAAIAAAAVLMVGGVTAAAATGLLDINSIFGGRISAEDEALAGELVIAAEDFTWSVSDDDYMIELKGVTGSKSDMLLMYEIKRTDGKPVTDFMTNIPEDGVLTAQHWSECSVEGGRTKLGVPLDRDISAMSYRMQYNITDAGNVEVYCQMITDGDISGTTVTIDNLNLYPKALLEEFEEQNNMYFVYYPTSTSPAGFYSWGGDEDKPLDIAINDERIIGLELEWTVQLFYKPNETAIKTKQMAAETVNLRFADGEGFGNTRLTLVDSEFSCVGGHLHMVRTGSMLGGSIGEEYKNEVYLIADDGEHVPCIVDGRSYSYNRIDRIGNYVIDVRYSETADAPITAIDISEITAISINGETFPLA